jgi:AcrR family transcriptional regulator
MANDSSRNHEKHKRNEILRAAKKLFTEKGYRSTSVREIVREAGTSMGNLYFHFKNKSEILREISREFVDILRKQINEVRDIGFSPEIGFALDFRIGYITTLEDPKLSRLWLVVRNTPEIHQYSLENKRIRLKSFFAGRIPEEELLPLATAIQGIADSFFEQKKSGRLKFNAEVLSNTIIDYSLRLLGFSKAEIRHAISEVERYVEEKHISADAYFYF